MYKQRKNAADFLNKKGYDIEFDADGFWMEEQRWRDIKTKEIADEMIGFAKEQKREMLKVMLALETLDKELYNYYFDKFHCG